MHNGWFNVDRLKIIFKILVHCTLGDICCLGYARAIITMSNSNEGEAYRNKSLIKYFHPVTRFLCAI